MLPQKYVKNFVLAQKLWILWPFFKSLLLGEQYMPFSDNVVKQHTHFFGIPPLLKRWLQPCFPVPGQHFISPIPEQNVLSPHFFRKSVATPPHSYPRVAGFNRQFALDHRNG